MYKIFSVSLFLLTFVVNAYEFSVGSIDIPESFEGPAIANPNPAAEIIGFKKTHEDGERATLLQISSFTPPNGIPTLSEEEHAKFAKQYLLQFLRGVGRQRVNFEQSEVETISLSNIPAAKITWKGEISGELANGTMYCVIAGGRIISFHTQDLSKYQNKYIDLAISSIENVRIER